MKTTILLVEDEYDTRELLERALERAGYGVLAAANARAALDLAKACQFVDVVVTDIVLDGDDRGGLGLMTELSRLGIKAPVVVVTAYADVEKVKIALNQGAAYFLEKPFAAAELLSTVERVLEGGQNAGHASERILSRVQLTGKERTVLGHLLDGLSNTEIAEIEHNSPKTIRQHVSQIYAKCGVGSRAELFRLVYLP